MTVSVVVTMVMVMGMFMAVRQGVLSRIVMAMAVTAGMAAGGVSAVLGLERFLHRRDDQVHGAQHVGQHVVGLYLEVIGLELNGHMAIAQVVGRANQVKRAAMLGAGRYLKNGLRGRQHPNQ